MKISSRNSGVKPGGSVWWFWVIALFLFRKVLCVKGPGKSHKLH